MKEQHDKNRIGNIYQMLFEMAAGNFNFSIPRSGLDDELEALVVLLNMVAEEMRASLLHHGFVNPHFSYQYLQQHTLVLTPDFEIHSFSADVPLTLGLEEATLEGKDFGSLLDTETQPVWNLIKGPAAWDATFHITISLNFKRTDGLVMPTFCTITRLLHSRMVIVSSVSIVVQEDSAINPVLLNQTGTPAKKEPKHDAQTIQKVYDYILDHLDTPLPSIHQLSQLFGTNTLKLKVGFRHFFNSSIYQFYNDERLKRAHLLIQQTIIPLSDIAIMCGFKSYAPFTKAFKKKFEYNPKDLQRGPIK